ncbi:MAG: cysteine-rich CWC family protein [Spongiibacteraceae bacterium]|nr:cysteine-rich CWC family protein [Spongiibacteraceae bacterium]
MKNTINTHQCPLCQQANQCAKTSDNNAKHCWCQQSTFSTKLLSQLPPPLRGKACICKDCAEKSTKLAFNIQ